MNTRTNLAWLFATTALYFFNCYVSCLANGQFVIYFIVEINNIRNPLGLKDFHNTLRIGYDLLPCSGYGCEGNCMLCGYAVAFVFVSVADNGNKGTAFTIFIWAFAGCCFSSIVWHSRFLSIIKKGRWVYSVTLQDRDFIKIFITHFTHTQTHFTYSWAAYKNTKFF